MAGRQVAFAFGFGAQGEGGGLPQHGEAVMSGRAAIQALRRGVLSNGGQDLLEYGLLMALIAIAAIAGVKTIGTTINTVFWEVIANNH